jgi:hypothetical protein
MTRLSSSTTNNDTNAADVRSADPKMVWSFTWEFDWSPAAAANAHTLRATAPRTGADELGQMLDKALAYAG